MTRYIDIRKNTYLDSVSLMSMSTRANAVEGVTQALLGVQEQGLAREGGIAAPRGLRELAPVRRKVGTLPAPLVALPALRKIPDQQPALRALQLRIGEIWPDGDGRFVTRDGLVHALHFLQYVATVVMRLGEIGFEEDSPVEAGERLVQPVQCLQCEPAIAPALRVGLIDGNRTIQPVQRVLRLPVLEGHHAQQMQGIEMPRLLIADLPVQPLGIGQAPRLVMRERPLHEVVDRLHSAVLPDFAGGPKKKPRDRKSTRLNSSHVKRSRMPSSA